MRCIIAGSRDFADYDLMDRKLCSIFSGRLPYEIVSGTARGADQLGETWARIHHVPVKRFPANWNLYGKSAGMRRNKEMVEYSTHAIFFWDGKSTGTKHCLDYAKDKGLTVRVILF